MANEVKQKIVLEGEQQYKQALKDAQRNLKTLRSELKAETAELGNNATAQQKNEARAKSLQKQIKEQENVVKTLKAALAEVKEKYGDNEDAVAKWEQKLNDARTTLAKMKNDLDGIGTSFKTMDTDANTATIATKSLADSLSSLSEAGESISTTVENIFTGMVNTVRDAIAEVWADVVDLAARSNNMVDLAGFWNTDVTTIQKYKGAVAEISGSFEDLTSLVTKLNAGDAGKIFAFTGVNKAEYKDEWQYAMNVMTSLSRMNHEARNNSAMEIFGGKQATKAFDLLNDWDKLLDHLDKYDASKGGYALTEEEIMQMSDLYDKVNGLRESWEALQRMTEVKLLGQLSMDLTSNAQAILDGFLKYFNAESDEEREAALKEVEDNIVAAFERIAKAIEEGLKILDQVAERLKSSDDPTVKAIGTVLGGLVDALQWITEDNMTHVVTALDILAGFWLTGKGLQMAYRIASVVKNINVIKAFNGGGAADTVTKAAGASEVGGSTVAAAGSGWSAVGGLAGLGLIATAFSWAYDRRHNHPEDVRGTDENLKANTQGDAGDLLLEYLAANKAFDEMPLDATEEYAEALAASIVDLYQKLMETEEGRNAWNAYSDWRQENSYGSQYWEVPDWYTNTDGGNTGSLTSEDISGFKDVPSGIKKAVREGVSDIKVYIDGEKAGRLLAPYVSQTIAEQFTV